jgi:uncharacterized protein (DUF433 family)
MNKYEFVTYDHRILGGKPIIKGTRISVELILEWISAGSTVDAIVSTYPHLKKEAVQEAIRYATDITKNEVLIESIK